MGGGSQHALCAAQPVLTVCHDEHGAAACSGPAPRGQASPGQVAGAHSEAHLSRTLLLLWRSNDMESCRGGWGWGAALPLCGRASPARAARSRGQIKLCRCSRCWCRARCPAIARQVGACAPPGRMPLAAHRQGVESDRPLFRRRERARGPLLMDEGSLRLLEHNRAQAHDPRGCPGHFGRHGGLHIGHGRQKWGSDRSWRAAPSSRTLHQMKRVMNG